MIPLRDASRTPVRFPVVTVNGGIAYAAHLGGAFFGILAAHGFERHVERRAVVEW
jgi:membrane associated rhomboid family serine protease